MKTNFTTAVIAATMFLVSVVSCSKDVANPNSTKPVSSAATEEIKSNQPTGIIIIRLDTTAVKKGGN